MNDELNLYYNTNGSTPCEYITRIEASFASNNYNIEYINKITNTIIDDIVLQISKINKNIRENIYKIDKFTDFREVLKVSKILAKDFDVYMFTINVYNQINSIQVMGLDGDDTRIKELQEIIDNHKNILYKILQLISNTYKSLFEEVEKKYNSLSSSSKGKVLETIKRIISIEYQSPVIQEGMVTNLVERGFKMVTSFLSKVMDHWGLVLAGFIGLYWLSNSEFLSGVFNFLDPIFKGLLMIPISIVIGTILFVAICTLIWMYNRLNDTINQNKNYPLNKRLDEINRKQELLRKEGKKGFSVEDTVLKVDTVNSDAFRGFNNTASYKPQNDNTNENDKHNIFS